MATTSTSTGSTGHADIEISPPVPLSLPLPCLIVDHDGAGGESCTTVLDVSKGEQAYQQHPCNDDADKLLRNRRRWMTAHGWVLSWDPFTLATFLWSPRTSETIDLPTLTREIPLDSACSLSSKPTATIAFTVVAVEPEDTTLWYCHVGGDCDGDDGDDGIRWVRHEYDMGSVVVNGRKMQGKGDIMQLTALRGKFYFFKSLDEIGVLEFSPHPVFGSVAITTIKRPPATNAMSPSCVEIDGKLHLVSAFLNYTSAGDPSLHGCGVYRMDLPGKRWRRVRNVGDRALLVCPPHFSGWCSAAASGLKPNCVYWMGRPGGGDNLLRIFDVNGGKESADGVHDPCKDIQGKICNATWMLPTDR